MLLEKGGRISKVSIKSGTREMFPAAGLASERQLGACDTKGTSLSESSLIHTTTALTEFNSQNTLDHH